MSIVGHLSGLHRGRLSADPPASRLQHRREPEASRPRTVHPRAEGRQLDARKTGKTGFNNFLFGVFLSFKFLLCPIIHLSPNFLPWLGISVTRFGEIPPLWQILKIFGNIFKVYLVLGNFSALFGTISMLLGKFSLLKMAKYWKHNLVVWSHCLGSSMWEAPMASAFQEVAALQLFNFCF